MLGDVRVCEVWIVSGLESFFDGAIGERTHEGQVHCLAKAPRGRAARLGIMVDVCGVNGSRLPPASNNRLRLPADSQMRNGDPRACRSRISEATCEFWVTPVTPASSNHSSSLQFRLAVLRHGANSVSYRLLRLAAVVEDTPYILCCQLSTQRDEVTRLSTALAGASARP